jgi:hypothetical protein
MKRKPFLYIPSFIFNDDAYRKRRGQKTAPMLIEQTKRG